MRVNNNTKSEHAGGDLTSVVVPVRNEGANLEEFCRRVSETLEGTGFDWEVIFVEDSSTDQTVDLLYEICEEDTRFKAVFLTRSFGHHEAISAGISFAMGQRILTMDGDLQHPPELIPKLVECYQEGYDMVYAQREGKQPFVKQVGSNLVNWIMRSLSDYPVDLNSSIFRLFSRKVADTLLAMPERRRFITGLLSWPGFRTKKVMFEEAPRMRGETKYSFWKMVELAFSAVISFTVKPLRLGIHFGFVCSSASFILGIYYVLRYFAVGTAVEGFTAIIVAVFFMGGVILLSLGIIGEYIGCIFIELKARPLFVVRSTLNLEGKEL